MSELSQTDQQQRIIQALGVRPEIDPAAEIERRIAFLSDKLLQTGQRALVLGISGGLDSTVCGRLAQRAVQRAVDQGHQSVFYAVRLPYGKQADADDAWAALDFIDADRVIDVNIKTASDAVLASIEEGGLALADDHERDFVLGNIKARQRMVAQYAIAGAEGGLVVGTDQAAEAVMGFFTKFGDGACDVAPLTGLTKRQVRQLAATLGAPEALVNKQPTADLESLSPQLPDEQALGVSYADIDAFLEGRRVSDQARDTIVAGFLATRHKRALPATPDAPDPD